MAQVVPTGIHNKVDTRIAYGYSRTMIALTLEGETITITFREGGVLVPPVRNVADVTGAFTTTGLYDAWTLEGSISIDGDILTYMFKNWFDKNHSYDTSAVVSIYSTADRGITATYDFGTARIAEIPAFSSDGVGGAVLVPVKFTLNNYKYSDKSIELHKGKRPT